MTDLCHKVYIKRNFQIWPKTKLSSFQSTVPPPLEFTTTHPPLTQRWKCSLEWNSCQWSLVEVTSFTSNMDFRNYMEFLRSNMSGYLGNLHKSLLPTLHLIFLDMREGMIGGWISVCVWMADVDLAHESSLPVSFLSISSRTALYIFIYLLPPQNDEEEDEFVRLFVKFICREG